jgi:hypothetical protein
VLSTSLRILAVPFVAILLTGCAPHEAKRDPTQSDLAKVESYLNEKHPGKKWQAGPARIDTDEVRAAYGKLRFYYVYSPPPVPPRIGAQLGPLALEEFDKARVQFEKDYVSLTIALDEEGSLRAYQKAEDFSRGLLKIEGEADAKTATAAVLSLFVADEVGPKTVAEKDITTEKDAEGRWYGSVTIGAAGSGGWRGTVSFDKDGRCTAVDRDPLVVDVP